jgi:hypothetical protein
MPIISDEPRSPPEHPMQPVSEPIQAASAADRFDDSPRGAFLLAGISVGLLFFGWLAFYFLLFLPRGSIG